MTKVNLFVKIFVTSAIPFGVGMGLLLGALGALVGIGTPLTWLQGATVGFLLGLLSAAPFGAAMALILGFLHFSYTSDPQVRHTRNLVVDTSPQAARDLCFEAIRAVPKVSVDTKLSNDSQVVAKKGLTMRSWGDLISCRIDPLGPDQQLVTVTSRPRLRTTIVDYGSNLGNVEAVVSYLLHRGARLGVDA
jgi:hypothetical protein